MDGGKKLWLFRQGSHVCKDIPRLFFREKIFPGRHVGLPVVDGFEQFAVGLCSRPSGGEIRGIRTEQLIAVPLPFRSMTAGTIAVEKHFAFRDIAEPRGRVGHSGMKDKPRTSTEETLDYNPIFHDAPTSLLSLRVRCRVTAHAVEEMHRRRESVT